MNEKLTRNEGWPLDDQRNLLDSIDHRTRTCPTTFALSASSTSLVFNRSYMESSQLDSRSILSAGDHSRAHWELEITRPGSDLCSEVVDVVVSFGC